jgi:hypothetical protein
MENFTADEISFGTGGLPEIPPGNRAHYRRAETGSEPAKNEVHPCGPRRVMIYHDRKTSLKLEFGL